MAKVIRFKEMPSTGLYDSDTQLDCVTEKVVDITDDCPRASKKERCVIFFTKAKRGQIAQIWFYYKNKRSKGGFMHFFVNELDKEMSMDERNDTFGLLSGKLGLNKLTLKTLIEAHAPSI